MNHKVIYIITHKTTDGSRILALAPYACKSSAHWCNSEEEALNCMTSDEDNIFSSNYASIEAISNNFKILAAYTDKDYPELFI